VTYGNELYSRTVFTKQGPSTVYFKAPEQPSEPEQETERSFTRKDKAVYTGYVPEAKRPIKKRKASKVGKAKQAKGKARSSKRSNA
jgi:hypothetical protein